MQLKLRLRSFYDNKQTIKQRQQKFRKQKSMTPPPSKVPQSLSESIPTRIRISTIYDYEALLSILFFRICYFL